MKLKKPKKEEVKILVVDDETIVALDIKNTLEKYGYNVVGIATTSQEAISLVKSSKPNLILMDIMIKGKKDGIETASEINEFADIPIVFLTAYSDDSTLERAKLVEPYGYLIKPFDNRELFTTIEMSLYKHSMEVSIRESEENLAITLNSIGDAVISTDEKGMIVKMNPVAELLTGWKYEEAKGLPLEKIFHLIDATTRKPIPNPVQRVIESGNVIGLSNHTLLVAKDGSERNISDSAAPIKDNSGNIRGVVLVFSDVTEAYNARKNLKESEEKFRLLITQMHQGIAVHEAIYDEKGKFVNYRFIEVNESFEKLTGLKREKIIGKTVLEVLPNTESYWIEKYGDVVKTGNPIVYENYSEELGRYYEVIAYRNRPDQFAVIVTDITDRKAAEENLRIKEQAIASSINAIAFSDLKGNLNYVNKSFLELWGYNHENEVLGRSAIEFWKDPKEAKKVLNAVLEKGSYVGELEAITKDKKSLTLALTSTLVYGVDGKPVNLMASFVDITERKRVEKELITSEEKFRRLVENAPLGIYYANLKGEFLYGNKVAEDLIGYKKEELIGKNFLQCGLLSITDIPYAAKLFARSLLGKPTGPDQLRLIRKDGTTVDVEISSQVLEIGGEKIILGLVQDITERKRSEERINLMAELLDLSPVSVIVHDKEGKILFANKSTLEMHGYSEEEFMKLTLPEIDTPESAKLIKERIELINKQGQLSFEVTHRRKDGSIFPLIVNTKITKWNNQEVLLSISTDITDRKLYEEALKLSENKFNRAFHATPVAMSIQDNKDIFLDINDAFVKLTGYSRIEIIGKTGAELNLWADPQQRKYVNEQFKKHNSIKDFEFKFRKKDGSTGFGILSAEVVVINGENAALTSVLDITERKIAEEQLQESEREFRTLFNSMSNGYYRSTLDGYFVDANPAFIKMLGYDNLEELKKLYIPKDVLIDPKNYENSSNGILETNERVNTYKLKRKDGTIIWIEDHVRMIKDEKENLIYYEGICQDITERKNYIEALQKSEFYLKKSQQVARIGSYLYDVKNDKWTSSEMLDEIFGIDEKFEKTSEGWLSIIHPEYKGIMQDHLVNHVILGKNRFDKEYKIVRKKDGKELWVHGLGELEYDDEGNPAFMVGTIQDITERKQAEAAIKQSEEKFRDLFNSMPNGYYRSTPDGYFIDANPAFIKMLGYNSLEELKNLYIPRDIYVKEEEREKILSSNPEFVSNVETYRLKKKDGTIIWVEDNARYIKDENGKVIFNEGICKDITDRKKAEDALRESEQLFNTLAQVSPVGIFRTDPNGNTTYVNPKWVRLSGLPADKAMGEGWLQALHPEDREKIKTGWNSTTQNQDISVAEYRFLRPDGNVIWVMGQAIPEFDAFNNVVGYVGTITDITERKTAEDALSESEERLRILAEKTGTIVYDWNLLNNAVHREGAIEDVLGYSKEEFRKIKADEYYNLFDKDELEQIKALTDKAIKSGGNYTHYYKLRHKKGHYIYIEDNGIVLKDNNGISYRMLGSLKDITAKKMAEDNLRKNEERFRILAEKTGTIVYDRDLINRKVHREGAIEEVLGYTREELNSFDKEQLEQMIDDKDKKQYYSNIKEIMRRPGSYSLNYKLKHKNGSFIYIEDNGIVLADESGKPVRILGSMRDITLKKLAEDELRKLSHAVEQSQVSIVITNKDGIIEYVNPKFCEVSGYSYDEAIGKKSNLLKSGEWPSETYKGLWDDLLSGRSWTGIFHNKKKNGELFWESAHISPIKDFNGEITNFIAVKEDITEKVKTEEQLTRYREHLEEMVEERTAQLNSQNEFLRSLIDTIPNPIFVKDSEGCYTDVNPAFEKLSGKKREELIGKKMDLVLEGDAITIADETDKQLLKEKGIVSYESSFVTGEGKKISILVYKASFGTLNNKPEGIVGIFFDISQRKELEEKTLAALNKEKELNEMKTNFISMASHEFRTPLTTILASADLVEMYYKKWPEDKVLNHIRKIQDSVNYMTTLLDDVLLLSRADRGKIKFNPTKVNLKELCSQILNEIQFQTVPGHNLIFDYKLKEEILTVDAKLLTQILNNLLSNAVKFSPEGGDILLEVTKKNNKIQFIVEDNGLGIDKNDIKKIFEPFYRGKNVVDINGSGLGMNIVQNAIEIHGGEISIECELNKGTKITFTIQTG